MRFPKKVVETALGLYTDGLSLKKTRERIRKIYRIVIKSNQTILNWLKKFGKILVRPIQGLAERLHGDETLIKTFKKGLFFYFWVIKCKGMQPAGWHLSFDRNLHEAKMLMWEARRRFPADYLPKFIRTDKMPAYRFAISSVFRHEVRHEKVISFKHGNNVIENFFRCKKRFPKFRTLESAKLFINHWMWENYGDDLFLLVWRHTFIGHNLFSWGYKPF